MAENSAIGWTDHTHNHWVGCQKAGPGCDNCYAEWLVENRMGRSFAERRITTPENRRKPEKWDRQAAKEGRRFKVFTNSLADVLDNQVPDDWRLDQKEGLFPLIERTPHLDWLIVTKRIGNWQSMRPTHWWPMPPRNVWLIATVCSQYELERDWLKLATSGARIIGLSLEPQLEEINLKRLRICNSVGSIQGFIDVTLGRVATFGAMNDRLSGRAYENRARRRDWRERSSLTRALDWAITGGESQQTPKAPARPYSVAWARRLIADTRGSKTALFLKQLGSNCPDAPVLRERKGADPSEWPADLRVQEFPR